MQPIEIAGLSKTYQDKRRRKVVALDGLNLQVGAGEVFGFLGPNGAGKSTTIKALVGLIRPTAGEARLFGLPVSVPVCRRRIGFLPENPSFYDFLTAREYLALVGRSFGMAEPAIRAESDRVLELLDLRQAERRPIRGYSKGMVQRLGLAQALLHDPDLYILDEPMSGLDPLGRALVKRIMLELKGRGKAVFFSTHVTADVEAVCDRVAVLVAGKLQAEHPVQELMEKGIVGYVVQFAGARLTAEDGFETSERPGGEQEVFVPKAELNRFMALVLQRGGTVRLMEPRRRDLERFFLDIVRRQAR
jgi:ABC-2 type transport system ATP-binding protein